MHAVDPLARNNVAVSGPATGTGTLVFVHGFGTDQRCWDAVAAAFPSWRQVRLDNVGASEATRPHFRHNHYLKLERYAADLVAVLDHLQTRDAVLVGHSVGAMICMLACLKCPEQVSRLVMIGASPHYQDEPGYHGGFRPEDVAEIYRTMSTDYAGWAQAFALAAVGDSNPHYGAEFAAALRGIPADVAMTVLYSILQSDLRSELAAVSQPTLLIQCREDHVVPLDVAQYLQAHIRGSRLELIDASGHLPHVTAPATVIEAMKRFLAVTDHAPRPVLP